MIAPLTNPPFSPNFSGNAASNNSATNVGGIANSGGPGGNSSGPAGGGDRGRGSPRTPSCNYGFAMIYPAPVIGGRLHTRSQLWMGGSLDPTDHDYHAGIESMYCTVCAWWKWSLRIMLPLEME